MKTSLWNSTSLKDWQAALDRYDAVIAQQPGEALTPLDRWYRDELPAAIAGRDPPHVTLDEIVGVAEWKQLRGYWRFRNLKLVQGNPPAAVIAASARAIAAVPHPSQPIAILAKLKGVGPATASGVMAAAAPDIYPFFDDVAAAQVPGLGEVAFTATYYAKYAARLRERAAELGHGWTPVMVERALWAHAGGKAGVGKQ